MQDVKLTDVRSWRQKGKFTLSITTVVRSKMLSVELLRAVSNKIPGRVEDRLVPALQAFASAHTPADQPQVARQNVEFHEGDTSVVVMVELGVSRVCNPRDLSQLLALELALFSGLLHDLLDSIDTSPPSPPKETLQEAFDRHQQPRTEPRVSSRPNRNKPPTASRPKPPSNDSTPHPEPLDPLGQLFRTVGRFMDDYL